jgi:hypothetical protein
VLAALRKLMKGLGSLEARLERLQLAVGRLEARLDDAAPDRPLAEREFQVFSQWGEDGILHYLTRTVPLERKLFVEFGVEDYTECNTRFLLEQPGWSGLVLDGSEENMARLRGSSLYWRRPLTAVAAFVTAENIDRLIGDHGITGDIALLSVDVDGNDYWIWKAITAISPRIVVAEYNALFGPEHKVTVPYDPAFVRGKAHASNLYYGASLAALTALAEAKGYGLVGCNSAGNNAFFVRRDVLGDLPVLPVPLAYRPASFREARDGRGALTFLGPAAGRQLLGNLPLFDLETGRTRTLADLFRA